MDHFKHMHLHNIVKRKPDVTTVNGQVMSVVYVTADPSFTGVIGSLSTSAVSSSTRSKQTIPPAATQAFSTDYSASSSATDSSSPTTGSNSELTASGSAQVSAGGPSATSTFTSASTVSNSYGYTSSTQRLTGATSVPNSQPTGASSSDQTNTSTTANGFSIGGKAGLAIGIIFVLGLFLALILVCIRRKKKQAKDDRAREDSEKASMVARQQHQASPRSPPTAPRLSLRPASSFLPEFMGGNRPKSRLSAGNMLTTIAEPRDQRRLSSELGYQMREKQLVENPFKDPENPFADPAQSTSVQPLPTPNPPTAPTPHAIPVSSAPVSPLPSPEPIAVAATGPGDLGAPKVALAVPRKPVAAQAVEMPGSVPVPAPLNTNRPENVVQSQAAVPESSVYRILMDFIPSMDDELELRQGQVVRLLHEYDDGWCLCTRLDRSQQGVVPRTCLAPKPSKPRPQPAPNGRVMSPAAGLRSMSPAQMRPMSPANQMRGPPQGRNSPALGPNSPRLSPPINMVGSPRTTPSAPASPSVNRPMSPGAYNQPPRPLSPGPRPHQKRSQSPGPYGAQGRPEMGAAQRRRSNSASAGAQAVRERRMTPPGPSRLGQESMGVAM